ncbi:hypothetical protein [Moritella sp. 28]|uniref:hypothetical protein n=1 Tax=Moritella sp. 28 TaxID=2746232 RepID=UPI001BA618DB|nr:hypothetical protein [Moritella sp. 28]QUM86049.1 hypothetical protein HWV02_16800 [Moritella sp. 28]
MSILLTAQGAYYCAMMTYITALKDNVFVKDDKKLISTGIEKLVSRRIRHLLKITS